MIELQMDLDETPSWQDINVGVLKSMHRSRLHLTRSFKTDAVELRLLSAH